MVTNLSRQTRLLRLQRLRGAKNEESFHFRFHSFIVTILLAASAFAQAKPSAQDTGFTSYVEFGGTTNSAGQVYELDSKDGSPTGRGRSLDWNGKNEHSCSDECDVEC